jgi:hypothetical protein
MNRSYRVHSLCLVACLLVVCSGSDGSGPGSGSGSVPGAALVIPPEATAADAHLKTQMPRLMPLMADAQSAFMYILNPGAALTPGMTLLPDTQPGAPAFSYVFDGIHDGNGDGVSETSLSGKVTYASDPSSLRWSPATGQATMAVQIPVVGHVYGSTLAFTATETEVRLSGSGTFTNPMTGDATTIEIPAGTPVVMKAVSAASNLVANACGYNVTGSVPVKLVGATGTLNSTWVFSPNTASVVVQQGSFRDLAGASTPMPDSTVALACGGAGTIDAWNGVYDQHWACLPNEHGHARLILTAAGATNLSINDEDPPGSGDTATYAATTVSANPHAVQGFFDAGPVGNRYREYFTWTLDKAGNFSQWSRYVYTEGPNNGSGGICFAIAKRTS